MSIFNSPITVKNIQLKNRLVMPPMATEKSANGGLVSDGLLEYYDEKSRGGYIGLIITEHSYILAEGKASPGQLSVAEDDVVPGLKRLTEVIHKNGSKVFAQINHAGGAANKDTTGFDPVSASAVVMPRRKVTNPVPAKEMTKADIARVTKAFADAARRVKEAGFDGVEIHSAHGYLLNQFYSPLVNHRTDEYTGSTMEGRIRFHLEVIKAVREAVGPDYPIALRLGACDYREGGSTVADGAQACAAFEAAGVDLLDISGGFCSYVNPNNTDEGYFAELTEAIKAKVKIPVILAGGIVTPQAAEALLQSGKTDLVGVARAILQDSSWAKKAVKSL